MELNCRLCGSPAREAFQLKILQRHDVRFFECGHCGSLQTEQPYWLQEAYHAAITSTDTGVVIRNVVCQAAIFAIARIMHVAGSLLDFGGGPGMLCRMLRDLGFDAYVSDRYADPVYARRFALQLDEARERRIGLLSAIEVFEHFENPAVSARELFSIGPRVIVVTTVLYHGEGRSWWYIGKDTGQHIFFYTTKAMEWLAAQHGYHYLGRHGFHVFSRDPFTLGQRILLRLAISTLGLRLVRIWIAATQRGTHADADFRDIAATLARGAAPGDADSVSVGSANRADRGA